MDFKVKIDRFWKYSEKHPELVIGTATLMSGLLAFLWGNGRFLFWVLLTLLFSFVLIFLFWRKSEPPQKYAWFFNVGENNQHVGSWEACRRYGFLSAGGGSRWQDAAKRLSVGEQVYAYVNEAGYVGFGEVIEEAVPIKDFTVGKESKPLISAGVLPDDVRRKLESASNHPMYSDWVVRVKWYKTYSKQDAVADVWASPQTVCRLTNKKNLNLLRQRFA